MLQVGGDQVGEPGMGEHQRGGSVCVRARDGGSTREEGVCA